MLPYRLDCGGSHSYLKSYLQVLVKKSYVLSVKSRKLISGPSPATKDRLLSFNRTQPRVVTGLLTGYNTLRRPLCVMGLSSNPTCWKCGSEEEPSFHVLCESETLASNRYAHLGSFFLEPEDIMNLSIGAIWISGKGRGLL